MKSWLPWRYLLRRAARRSGFIDPIDFLARLRQFAQPSEVQEPIELIRAGVVFHARGLVNTRVIQNNLDWIWPYWVVRQFDPSDPSFLPRAFSFTHVNLTHRNWTAIGMPGMRAYPIVDPRGLVTPLEDGWSLDWWFIPDGKRALYPSRCAAGDQRLDFARGLEVVTTVRNADAELCSRAWVERSDDSAGASIHSLCVSASVRTAHSGRLVLAVRPANPEGIRFVDEVACEHDALIVNRRHTIRLEAKPAGFAVSTYAAGDLPERLGELVESAAPVRCPAGLATAAAIFAVRAGNDFVARARFELPASEVGPHIPPRNSEPAPAELSWKESIAHVPTLEIPIRRWVFLHEAAVRTLVLLSPDDVFPGPYTYRRFWFRDACLMMNALLAMNLEERARRAFARFPARQRADGFFQSQEGEWDSNGQVLWIADRIERTSGRFLPREWLDSLARGARWLVRKRATTKGGRHEGLLPPGFSAEHFGPNDYYYWDDFWGVAGLRALAALHERRGDAKSAQAQRAEAGDFAAAIERSLGALPEETARLGVPVSPYRRMDAAAIGSLVADYPLHLPEFDAGRRERTADWLWHHCRFAGGFFQDLIHSGINAYLTLALAQTFLRLGDGRFRGLVETVGSLASPTGQWPEAVHPRTRGGCMGDGQHGWAAAEWALMMRALFLREEDDHLVVGAGLFSSWLEQTDRLAYGPTATAWGPVNVVLVRRGRTWFLRVHGKWHGQPPRVWMAVPGFVNGWAQPLHWETPLVRAVERAPAPSPVR